MTTRPRKFLLPVQAACLLFSGPLVAQGQAADSPKVNETPGSGRPEIVFDVQADRTSVSVGDRVVLTYTARIPAGSKLVLEALVTPEPPEGQRPPAGAVLEFETPKPPAVDEKPAPDGTLLWTQTVAFIPFMAGTVVAPGPHLTFEGGQGSGPSGASFDVRPPAVTLQVASRLPKDAKPDSLPPKDDRPVRLPSVSPFFWAGLAACLALFALALWWRIRRRRRPAAAEPAAPLRPAGEEFLEALALLAGEAEALGDDPRGFYSRLTQAVKRYLERRLDAPVLEWTTFETVRRLREKGFELPREVAFADLLSAADLVKFGKGRSTRDDARAHLSRARLLHDHVEARLAPPPADAAKEKSAS